MKKKIYIPNKPEQQLRRIGLDVAVQFNQSHKSHINEKEERKLCQTTDQSSLPSIQYAFNMLFNFNKTKYFVCVCVCRDVVSDGDLNVLFFRVRRYPFCAFATPRYINVRQQI